MTKRLIILLLVAIIYSPFFAFTATDISEEPIKVLLLHSYSQNLSWTADENEGFFNVIEKSGYNFDVTVEYMDTKHYYSDSYYDIFDTLFKHKHLDNIYDIIAVTDDNALRYILSLKNDYFMDTPLFFCGSNAQIEYKFDQYHHIYGIRERTSLKETLSLINKLQPNLETIYFLFDESKTAELTINDLKTQIEDHKLLLNFTFLTAATLDELVNQTENIKDDASAFIYGFYMTDASGIAFDPNDSARLLVNKSSLPIYALWDFSMNTGAIGGKLISGQAQGNQMALLLINYLEDTIAHPLLDASLGSTYIVDYTALDRFQLDDTLLPQGTVILNKPESFYERHQSVILSAAALSLLLIFYIVILRIQIKRKTQTIKTTTTHMMEYKRQASLTHLVTGVAHDINTPLGNIITLTDFAKSMQNNLDEVDPKMISTLSTIEQSASSIATLINNFRQISIDTAQTNFSLVSKESDSLSESIERIGSLILSNQKDLIKLEVTGKKSLQFPISDQHLYGILEPLIQNSMTHGFVEDGFHLISINLIEQSDGIQIRYKDNGIGIKDQYVDALFEPFFSTAKHKKHSGLGLFSAYNTVTAHCGTIEFIQKEKTGATFLITLPYSCSII
jgi:signal transduction histidine kinase